MKKNRTFAKHLFVCLFMLVFFNVDAQNVATFLTPIPAPPANCNDTWTEDGIPLEILPHFPSGTCDFDYNNQQNPGDLWLFPARLGVDLSVFPAGIDSIRVVVTDFCTAVGCTNGTISNGGNVVATFQGTGSGAQDWLWENTNQVPVDLMQLQSFEGQFHEVLIFPTLPPQPYPAIEQVGIGEGDIYVKESFYGVILTSPNGTCYRIVVDDNGELHTEQVTCP